MICYSYALFFSVWKGDQQRIRREIEIPNFSMLNSSMSFLFIYVQTLHRDDFQ